MKTTFKALLTGTMLLLGGAGQALADSAIAIEGGSGEDDTNRGGFVFQWTWPVQWLDFGGWYLGGYSEVGVSFWQGIKGRSGNDSLGDFSITPVLRYQPHAAIYGVIPYIEGGVGAHLLTENELGDNDFSINYTFGDHIGAGVRFGQDGQFELGYRFQHLSNAGLGDSNPGINFHLVRLAYHY